MMTRTAWTGAAAGIGRACAKRLATDGTAPAMLGIGLAAREAVVAGIGAAGDRTFVRERGPLGITLGDITPGTVMNTVMSEARRETMPGASDRMIAAPPAGRQGERVDIAHALSWCAKAGYVTGQTIGFDGGCVPS